MFMMGCDGHHDDTQVWSLTWSLSSLVSPGLCLTWSLSHLVSPGLCLTWSHLVSVSPGLCLTWSLSHLVLVVLVVLPPQKSSLGLRQAELLLIGRLVHLPHLRQQEGGYLGNRKWCHKQQEVMSETDRRASDSRSTRHPGVRPSGGPGEPPHRLLHLLLFGQEVLVATAMAGEQVRRHHHGTFQRDILFWS
ncbi:hypothetical protein F7725_014830 [Dissostichus mawsoni]|uniref:Uncharacterized protein n=1 Tax=Dissostichus mawsoni TaxID=36200 RepID=A0A7J5YGS1_DISMA|nr:hypothetical protein F7725_014830 [Dissostichus mawsoni]